MVHGLDGEAGEGQERKVPVAVFLAVIVSLEFITRNTDGAKAIYSTCGIPVMHDFCVCKRLRKTQKELLADRVSLQA